MKKLVNGDAISRPESFDEDGIFKREKHPLDDLSHAERYRVFKRLEKRVS